MRNASVNAIFYFIIMQMSLYSYIIYLSRQLFHIELWCRVIVSVLETSGISIEVNLPLDRNDMEDNNYYYLDLFITNLHLLYKSKSRHIKQS